VAVEARWAEMSAEGQLIKWSPSLEGKRGETVAGTVSWGGMKRTLTVTIR
jgi:hypothetical protein